MALLKELKDLALIGESYVKDAMFDMIEQAAKQTDVTGLSREAALAKICDKVVALDTHGLLSGFHPDAIRDMIEPYVDEEDFVEEGVLKSIKRSLSGWGTFAQDGPKELVKRNMAHDLETAKMLRKGLDTAPEGSPAALQRKVLDRRLKNANLDSAGTEIKAGDTLIWKDENGTHTGTVVADPKYNGGLKIGGRSVKNIIDDSDSVKIVKEDAEDASDNWPKLIADAYGFRAEVDENEQVHLYDRSKLCMTLPLFAWKQLCR